MGDTSMQDDLAATLSAYLSRHAGKAVPISNLQRMSNGWESDVYAFDAPDFAHDAPEADDTEQAGEYVLRLYFGTEAGAKAQHEYRSLDLLARAGYPVPRVELVEPSPEPLGRTFLVMQRLQGISLGRRWSDPDPTVRQQEIERFCSLFATLHKLAWQYLPGAEHVPSYTISQQMDEWKWYGRRFEVASIPQGMRWLDKAQAQIVPQPLGLVHWDFHHENILVAEDRAWVIDWTQLQATDVRFDVAWTLVLLMSERDPETAQAVRRGYYAQRGWSDVDVADEMHYFEAAASLKRLVSVLISLKSGPDALGMRPGAEAIMTTRLSRIAIVYRRWLELTGTPLPEIETMLVGHL